MANHAHLDFRGNIYKLINENKIHVQELQEEIKKVTAENEKYVDSAIANIPEPDLSNCLKKDDVYEYQSNSLGVVVPILMIKR